MRDPGPPLPPDSAGAVPSPSPGRSPEVVAHGGGVQREATSDEVIGGAGPGFAPKGPRAGHSPEASRKPRSCPKSGRDPEGAWEVLRGREKAPQGGATLRNSRGSWNPGNYLMRPTANYVLSMEYEVTCRTHKESESTVSTERNCGMYGECPGRRGGCNWGIWMLLLALLASGCVCFVMFATDVFAVFIQKNLILRNETMRYEAWRRPPVQAVLKVYLFNYTNVDEYEAGIDRRLIVKEVGPYSYVETWERVNVTHNGNGTLTYRDRKTYKFSRELSNGSESDVLVVPNIPFLGVVAFAKSQNFIAQLSIMSLLMSIRASLFMDLTVHQFLWGYSDQLSFFIGHYVSMKFEASVSDFGIFVTKNQTQEENVTIYTGEENYAETGVISEYGAKRSLDYWQTKECNRIDGTDGTIYPPGVVKPNSTLYLYVKDMCRRIPLRYESSKTDQHGISVFRFRLDRNVFDNGKTNPENQCFCQRVAGRLDCLPSGVFNVSPCAFGGPIITSLPHFLYGDSELFQDFAGLYPDPEIHESFVEIDSRLGIPLTGKSRFQLNVMLRKTMGFNRMPYKDKLILPVSWMDYGVDHCPEDLSSMIYNLLLFIDITEICLSYGFVLACLMLCGLIVKKLLPAREMGLLQKNLELSAVDLPLMDRQGKT